ncbi:AAA family ATPase [Sulfitobacter sp. F26169L]|uniref:AAA family ATPase n=1 Tax=Sulfitobacter sp. F26169L TaxID=2996015 RepID=UPI002260CAAF|nr:AAA family ATPase [Sulfitobacter sp. F26169L]MCX7566516.1 AAA family ATPase [Sulfitobacter sp. F26169L]
MTANNKSVAIAPKAFSVLVYLIENRDRMVAKLELLDQFWTPEVSEAALQTTISVIRKALDDQSGAVPCIKTYHGMGFRFVAQLRESNALPSDGRAEAMEVRARLQEQWLVAILTLKLGQDGAPLSRDLPDAQLDALIKSAEFSVKAAKGRLMYMLPDGFSATFGFDPHLEDGTRFALICAHEIINLEARTALEGLGISVSIGVDTGATIHGETGAASEWNIPGGAARHSAELASRAGNGRILVSGAVKNLLRDEIEAEPIGDDFLLFRPPDERVGLTARPFARQTPFVGRGAEMSFLRANLLKCDKGECQTVILLGPAGIGKSRLVSEFLADMKPGDGVYHKYYCMPRHCETPLALLRQMCIDLFAGIDDFPDFDPIDKALLRALLNDAERPDPILEGVSDFYKHQRTLALIERFLEKICTETCHVLVVEDVHWMDKASHRYLEALIRTSTQGKLMIILTARPSGFPSLTESVLQLAPLGQMESRTLLHQIPELANLAPPLVETLVQRAAGNPFFLEELAHATKTGSNPSRDLPDTVQAVIEVRIAELDNDLRMIVYMVSVVGQPAKPALIAHLMGLPQDTVQARLDRLISLGFLHEDEDHLVCRHMLFQDTAYAMLVPKERAELHKKIALYFEGNAETNPVRPEILGSHFQEAGDTPRAITYWIKASYAALVRSAHPEAAVFSNYGLDLVAGSEAEGTESEMRLQLAQAQALMAMKGYGFKGVGTAYGRVYVLSRTLQNFSAQARALVGLWVHTWVLGQLNDAMDHATNLIEMGRQSKEPSLLIQGHGGLGEVMTHTGRLSEAMTHLVAGMDVVQNGFPKTITDQNSAVTCAAYAAWVSAMQGRFDDMQYYYAQSRDLSEVFENRFAQAIHLALCSEAFMFAGDVNTCLDLATRAVEMSRENGFPFWLGTGLVMRGWALGQKGDTELGLAELENGIAVFERTGAGVQLANWYGLKAETLFRAGRTEDAETAAEYALDRAEQAGDVWFKPRIYAVMERILTALDRPADADACALKVAQFAKREHLAASFITVPDRA